MQQDITARSVSIWWRWAPIAIVVVGIGILFFGLVTKGTYNPFHRLGLRAVFFEDQARSLLHGHLWVTPEAIDGEAIVVNGHSYGYFGIVPALLRVPVMLFFPTAPAKLWWPYWWPYLAAWYFTTAYCLEAICAVGLARWCTRQVMRIRIRDFSRWDAFAEGGIVAAILGSSTLFLTARIYPYEEAILWGVVFALAAFWCLLLLHETRRLRYAVLAAVCSAASIGSRPTVGGGAILAMVCFIPVMWNQRRAAYVLATGAVFAAASYCLVTEWKFGTLITPPLQFHIQYANNPHRLALLKAGSDSLRYLPTALLQFLRPDTVHFMSAFPWVAMRMPTFHAVHIIGNVQYDGIEPTSSLTATMPLLCALAAVGVVRVVKDGSLRALALGGLAGGLATASVFGMSNRYLNDFVPFLVIVAVAGSVVFRCWTPRRGELKVGAIAILVVLGLWSIFVNAAFAGQYNGLP